VPKSKHCHSPILIENAYVWGTLKALGFFWERPIKEAHCKKNIEFGMHHIWMYPQYLIKMNYK